MNKILRVALVLFVAVIVPAVGCSSRGSDHQIIKGAFLDASPLETGSEVRADGVLVGKVKSIELERKKGVAIVSLDVQKNVLPVHQDARMIIKPINLLGENYLDLDPGSPKKAYFTGDMLGTENTENAVTLQGVLDSFDDPTSAGLAALLLTAGEGLEGNGQNAADAIKALGPAMQDIDRLGDILREQNDVLASLVDHADPVSKALTKKKGKDLDRMIASLTSTLEATRDKQEALATTIDELPATLTEARRTFSALQTVSDELGPTLKKARPVTKDLRDISDEIVTFSKYADPAFNGFDALFKSADQLLKQAAPIASSLREHGSDLTDITHTVDFASQELLDKHRRELMTFVRYWALSTNSRDAASHYFRGVVHITPATLQMLLGSQDPLSIGEVDALKGLDPAADATNDLLSDITGNLAGLGGGSTGSGSSSAQKSDETDDGATGLTPKQEQGLLGQLLGGLS
ncbi:MlaD family protein [Aeromicrobium ginsengisoli]|uniref:MCE family protein n=1 Tax=Aeromicrobium ginsengisoli TaxID=363867 RepID=A0A5M4FAH1_9ACTN|nr:MlaD family protein [Aeromicrobium ginsengisoli]KAA1394239.1 MCE family protein [Aeromicrobium ginsengisoli]